MPNVEIFSSRMRCRPAVLVIVIALFAVTARGTEEVLLVRAGRNQAAIRMTNLASEQLREGRDLVDARRKLDAAIATDPTLWPAYYSRAQLDMREEKYAAAVVDATFVLRRKWFSRAALLRASANWKLGKLNESIAETEHVITLQPAGPPYPSALNTLAWIRATCPNPAFRNGQSAINYAKRACSLTGWRNAGYIDTLAAAYAEAGEWESAVRFQEQAISRGGASAKQLTELQQHLAFFKQQHPVRS